MDHLVKDWLERELQEAQQRLPSCEKHLKETEQDAQSARWTLQRLQKTIAWIQMQLDLDLSPAHLFAQASGEKGGVA